MKARIVVVPRREVLDPQGMAIRDALGRIGFGEVQEVRAGKTFDIDLAGVDDREKAEEMLRRMSEELLANPVVEDYAIELVTEEGSEA